MAMKVDRKSERILRHKRVRKKITGTAERPRLNIFKSHKNFFLQVIDDKEGKTVVSVSTTEATLKGQIKSGGNIEAAKKVGSLIAERAIAKGIKQVVFDRGGNKYHGAVKALADAARESGLEF